MIEEKVKSIYDNVKQKGYKAGELNSSKGLEPY